MVWLPPIIFAMVGGIGFVVTQFAPDTILALRDEVLAFAGRFNNGMYLVL